MVQVCKDWVDEYEAGGDHSRGYRAEEHGVLRFEQKDRQALVIPPPSPDLRSVCLRSEVAECCADVS